MENLPKRISLFLFGAFFCICLLLLQGCVLPYPEDLRPTLTVVATEFRPTPTGFSASIGRATPPPPEPGVGGGAEGDLPSELSGGSPLYAVIFVGADNFLNVRSAPGVDSEIVTTLEANDTDLRRTGAQQELAGDLWVEIELEDGQTGWVSSVFLTQQVPEDAFCRNARIRTLMRDLIVALQNEDLAGLSRLINPQRGLFVRTDLLGYEIWLPPEAFPEALDSPEPLQWGLDLESGEVISGSLAEYVLAPLQETVQADYQQGCNTLSPGVSLGGILENAVWPYELTNLNYLTIYQPAPTDRADDWRTWAVGAEVLDGIPYITYLIQYRPPQ